MPSNAARNRALCRVMTNERRVAPWDIGATDPTEQIAAAGATGRARDG
jgi:hypothetical protein